MGWPVTVAGGVAAAVGGEGADGAAARALNADGGADNLMATRRPWAARWHCGLAGLCLSTCQAGTVIAPTVGPRR